jgi:methionyl-tRNA formyltransferase
MINSDDSVVIFGDELGIPLVMEALGETRLACVVIDPKRENVKNWHRKNEQKYRILTHPRKEEQEGFARELMKFNPRLGIVASYSRILWPELLALFPLNVVNLHGGRLPEYRGANVLQWAIINGETETSVTLHYVDQGIDTGPVIAESRIPIDDQDTAVTLRDRMSAEGKDLLRKWLPYLLKGDVETTSQDESKARVWRRRKPEDGLIDWAWPDEQVRNLIRALVKPWPGAFYFDGLGKKVVIDRLLSLEEVRRIRRELLDDRGHTSA